MSFLFEGWITGAVTWVGTILTLLGLYFTWRQAGGARKAAEAAADAVNTLEHRITLTNVTYANVQIDVVMAYMKSNDFQVADVVFASAKRTLIQICHLLSRTTGEKDTIAFIKRNISTIETQIDLAVEQPSDYKPTILNKAANGLSESLTEIERKLTFPAYNKYPVRA